MTSTAPYALVVDDDAFILLHATDILEAAGFRFYEAANGDDAVELLDTKAGNVTLLFTDVDMPGTMNGFALARHLDRHWPWIEIVVASGQRSPADRDLPKKATFIPKPFSKQIVHDHLRQTLTERNPNRYSGRCETPHERADWTQIRTFGLPRLHARFCRPLRWAPDRQRAKPRPEDEG